MVFSTSVNVTFDLGDANFKAQILKEEHVRELWVYNKLSHAISIT